MERKNIHLRNVVGFYYTILMPIDENTIFQGVSPVSSSPSEPESISAPDPSMQHLVPQPIAEVAPVQAPLPQTPLPVQPSTPPQTVVGVSSPPPPIIPPDSLSGRRFPLPSLPTGGIVKAIIGLLILLFLGFVIFGVIIPNFFSNKDEKVTLTYWGLWEDPNVMQKVIDDFQQENPTIVVKYEKQNIKDQYRDRLLTRINNGDGPDMFQFHNTWLGETKNVLTPLPTDVITPEQFKKTYYPVVVNDVTQNGAIYGVPLQMDTLALFTNTDMLAAASLQPPTNWEDFGKYARVLTVKDENGRIKTAGAALGTFDNVTHAPDILSLLFLQNGADINDLSSTEQQSSDTFNYYTSYSTGESNVWDSSLDPSLLAFAKGNLAMYFGYSWDIFIIKAINPDLRFQVTPVPHLPLGRKTTVASYWVEGVSQKSKHQKEAMLFMKYLTKKETLQKMYTEASKVRGFGPLYPRPDLAASLKDNGLVYPFVSQAGGALSSFFVSDTYDNGLNEKANTYLGNAVRSLLEGTSAQTALETLSAGVTQVLEKYGRE